MPDAIISSTVWRADLVKKLAEVPEKSVRITDHYETVVQEKESECFEYLIGYITRK